MYVCKNRYLKSKDFCSLNLGKVSLLKIFAKIQYFLNMILNFL